MIKIDIIPVYSDNYAYLIQTPDGTTAVIDPGEAEPVIDVLDQRGLTLNYILNTHHHWDHVDGNPALRKRYDLQVVAPAKEVKKVGHVDIPLHDEDVFTLGDQKIHIIETPGHTIGGICFYFPASQVVFTGDSVFSMGCGRLFEGTAADMFASFQKIKSLPDDTLIYCGHEYTKGNAGFCLSQDKNNPDLKKRIEEIKQLRAQNLPTIPISLSIEKKTNIFMKAKSADEFAALRKKKDRS
ncbi:MAG: hydroxyacylglutathione hydrolase [Alphaproteobacteria bacterium]